MIFETQVGEWSRPPIGGVNTPNDRLAFMTDEEVREWVELTWPKQYGEPSNWRGLYRSWLGLDNTHDRTVLDFGCGFGFDALSYARTGNEVLLADIVHGNLMAATRVLMAHGYLPSEIVQLNAVPGDFHCDGFDIFHASGVLHHMPAEAARRVLYNARVFANDEAEARLMLYTDHLWMQATKTPTPPIDFEMDTHPAFLDFVRFCDAVGFHAEWYNEERMQWLVEGTGWKLLVWEYIRQDNGYGIALLQAE